MFAFFGTYGQRHITILITHPNICQALPLAQEECSATEILTVLRRDVWALLSERRENLLPSWLLFSLRLRSSPKELEGDGR